MKNKKIILTVFTFLFAFGLAVFLRVNAAATDNVSGWLWGGSDTNVGWISANNTSGGGSAAYGLNIPATDGALSGYAWSENIGWVSFNSGDVSGCPSGTCSASRVGSNLQGWARIIGIKTALAVGNSGGWQGWVKLNGSAYGVSINTATNALSGYAWSDELGWIDFSRAAIAPAKTINATITASPSSVSVNTTPVSITATINPSGTTATGNNITYQLDCTNDGTPDQVYNSTTGELSHIFSNACMYSVTSTAAVRISRDGVSVTPTTPVTFTVCGSPYTYSCTQPTAANCGACGSAATTLYWTCVKRDSCSAVIPGISQPECQNNGINSCTDITCPACPVSADRNWKEVAP